MTAYVIADIDARGADQHPVRRDDVERASPAIWACLLAKSAADRYAGSARTTVTVITNSTRHLPGSHGLYAGSGIVKFSQ